MPEDGLITNLRNRFVKDKAPVMPTKDQIKNASDKARKFLDQGTYTNLVAPSPYGGEVVDLLLEDGEFTSSREVIRIKISPGDNITGIHEQLTAGVPGDEMDNQVGKLQQISQAMSYKVKEAEQPVLLIYENMQNMGQDGRNGLIRQARAFFQARGRNANMKKLTCLIVADQQPSNLLDGPETQYNIGRNVIV